MVRGQLSGVGFAHPSYSAVASITFWPSAVSCLVCSVSRLAGRHARKMGLEGIVSKRLGSRYTSGRSPDWLKFKNPNAPAVKREAEMILSSSQLGTPQVSVLASWRPPR